MEKSTAKITKQQSVCDDGSGLWSCRALLHRTAKGHSAARAARVCYPRGLAKARHRGNDTQSRGHPTRARAQSSAAMGGAPSSTFTGPDRSQTASTAPISASQVVTWTTVDMDVTNT